MRSPILDTGPHAIISPEGRLFVMVDDDTDWPTIVAALVARYGSQRALAARLGTSQSHVHGWLHGKTIPRRLWQRELLRVYEQDEVRRLAAQEDAS